MARKKKGVGASFKKLIKTCSDEEFAKISEIISGLINDDNDFLVIELIDYPKNLSFIQTARDKTNYLIEIGLETENSYPEMFRLRKVERKQCVDIIKQVCCDGILPDLTEWENITNKVFTMEGREWFIEKYEELIRTKQEKAGEENDDTDTAESENRNDGIIIGFYDPDEEHGCFSNRYKDPFMYAGVEYSCVEQYMLAKKVEMGRRYDLSAKIMASDSLAEMKAFTGEDFFEEIHDVSYNWDRYNKRILRRAIRAKFLQNKTFQHELLSTGNAIIAECNPNDHVWGIGISKENELWRNPINWKGDNDFGKILMEIRDEIRSEIDAKGHAEYVDYTDAEQIPMWMDTPQMLLFSPIYHNILQIFLCQIAKEDNYLDFCCGSFQEAEDDIRSDNVMELPKTAFFEMKQVFFEMWNKSEVKTLTAIPDYVQEFNRLLIKRKVPTEYRVGFIFDLACGDFSEEKVNVFRDAVLKKKSLKGYDVMETLMETIEDEEHNKRCV